MRNTAIIVFIGVIFLLATGPTTRPVTGLGDVEARYNERAAAAKRVYADELAKADEERLANLQILLSRAMKAEDVDQVIAIKKKIDEVHGDGNLDNRGKSIVYLCQKSSSMLSVFGIPKQNLKESINALDSDQEFSVIFFCDEGADPLFKNGLRAASSENKKLAMTFVDNEVASGGTLPLPAIQFAMREKPELLYFLTDGLTNMANPDSVMRAFKQANPDGKTKINCIFLQSTNDPALEQRLKQISGDGHGTFRKILKSDM